MKFFCIVSLFLVFSVQNQAQNLDKLRVLCLDQVDLANYDGELSKKQLQDQVAALGFRYIEEGKIKYHDELIVYDCNTGVVQFTANFDQNRLVKDFVQYAAKDVPAKKINFAKGAESRFVDLQLHYNGQDIPAYPVGKAEIFNSGSLDQEITFNQEGVAPLVTNYNRSLKKVSEGQARISGNVLGEWNVSKIGEWKFYEQGKLASVSIYDNKGNVTTEKLFQNGVLEVKNYFINNETVDITEYYGNGNTRQTGIKNGSVRIDNWKFFDESGNLSEEIEYLSGQVAIKKVFNKEEQLIKKLEIVKDQNDLPQGLEENDLIYQATQYFANSEKLKASGYETKENRVGIFEFYDQSGALSEIIEYDLKGKEINSVKAETYLSIKEKEGSIYRELLVAKTTHPLNLNSLQRINSLSDSLDLHSDSLLNNYEYKKEYETEYSQLLNSTASFGKLSNDIAWYDSLLAIASDFNSTIWSYSQELFETELKLERKAGQEKAALALKSLKENHTSMKNTLFGEKRVVENDQDEVYEVVEEEIYPTILKDISGANSKYVVDNTILDFKKVVQKAGSVISKPNNNFKKSLKNADSIQDKKKLFLSEI